ncbi:MAG: type II toxin-antitoxin system VapC family toxin [Flavobacteriales bacterium]|nr:MAG: type II toxin-antitoxin system VapC family toxin [Flavobacteriales bacterium]
MRPSYGKHLHVLLDTHVLLWAMTDDKRLSPAARDIVTDKNHYVVISIVSLWEVAIKSSISKLDSRVTLRQFKNSLVQFEVDLLDMDTDHIESYTTLPLHHRDPFDRMLIAQAKHEGLHILTADPAFKLYDVNVLDI